MRHFWSKEEQAITLIVALILAIISLILKSI